MLFDFLGFRIAMPVEKWYTIYLVGKEQENLALGWKELQEILTPITFLIEGKYIE